MIYSELRLVFLGYFLVKGLLPGVDDKLLWLGAFGDGERCHILNRC